MPEEFNKLINNTCLNIIEGVKENGFEPPHASSIAISVYVKIALILSQGTERSTAVNFLDLQLDILNSTKEFLQNHKKGIS